MTCPGTPYSIRHRMEAIRAMTRPPAGSERIALHDWLKTEYVDSKLLPGATVQIAVFNCPSCKARQFPPKAFTTIECTECGLHMHAGISHLDVWREPVAAEVVT